MKLKLSTKVIAGYVFVSIFMGALVLWTFSAVGRSLEDSNKQIQSVSANLAAINGLVSAIEVRAIEVRHAAIARTPEEITTAMSRYRQADEDVKKFEIKLKEQYGLVKTADSDVQVIVVSMLSKGEDYRAVADKAIIHSVNGEVDQAKNIIMGDCQRVLAELRSLAIKYREHSLARLNRAQQDHVAEVASAETQLLYLGLTLAFLAILYGSLLSRNVNHVLGAEPHFINHWLKNISEGDFKNSIKVKDSDRKSVAYHLSDLQDRLSMQLGKVLDDIKSGSEAILSSTNELSVGTRDLSVRTENQASALEETASAVEEISQIVMQSAESSMTASTLSKTVMTMAVKGEDSTSVLSDSMQKVSESSDKIYEITALIEAIAFQTNILSLNAAVEAARAGETGRGFTVVASEVRVLSKKTADAAASIKTLIEGNRDLVQLALKYVGDVSESVQVIKKNVNELSFLMGNLATSASEQAQGIEQINQAISEIDQNTQQNAALVEQASAALDNMMRESSRLNQSINSFKI